MSPRSLVKLERHGGVAVLMLDEPERRNILTGDLVNSIGRALDAVEADPAARCVVVTGAGTAFCAGADLDTLTAAADGDFGPVEQVYAGFLRVLHCPLPTIAAVNGPAVGAGMNLALACDVRIAADRAVFDSRFAALNIHPGGGHAWMLARAVGSQQAILGCLFGQVWDSAQALRLGLVAEVHPMPDLIPAAIALGNRLDSLEQVYVSRLIATLRLATSTLLHGDALADETQAQQWSTTRPNFRENVDRIRRQISAH